jgi:hypothetical protein
MAEISRFYTKKGLSEWFINQYEFMCMIAKGDVKDIKATLKKLKVFE